MFFCNSTHNHTILIKDISGESILSLWAYSGFGLELPVSIRWSRRGKFSTFRPLADPTGTQRSGLGVLESETWALSERCRGIVPPRLRRPSLNLELFTLQPRAAGVLWSDLLIAHFRDARQRTVRDAFAVPVWISQSEALRRINVDVRIAICCAGYADRENSKSSNELRRITAPLDPRYIRHAYSKDPRYVDPKHSARTNQIYIYL